MGDIEKNAYWKYDIDTRAGNMVLPYMPREFTAVIKDHLTLETTEVNIDGLTIITSKGKTCGSIQLMTVANMLIWSSFETFRFTLIVNEKPQASLSALSRQSASLQITGQNSHSF